MMRIVDSFLQVFDRTHTHISAKSPAPVWTVVETKSSAKIKRLIIDVNGAEYVAFDDWVSKEMPNITTDRSTILENSECDGIAIIKREDNLCLLFCDLKSKFNNHKIIKALNQDLASFLKMYMLLSVCNGFELSNCNIDFIVACQCFENDNVKADMLSRIHSIQMENINSFDGVILYPLLMNGEVCVKLGDFPQVACLDINPIIKNKNVKLRLLTSSNYSDDFVSYRI